MSFSFSFAGDDIDASTADQTSTQEVQQPSEKPAASAFPVPGKPQLPPIHHDLKAMLSGMPSKIAYSTLDVVLDDGETIQLPRRELWDVRVQLMAEETEADENQEGEGLGDHDVKTGVYEGGFKSWESSIDLVKVLATESHPKRMQSQFARVIELGCGTALPSLALFQWAMMSRSTSTNQPFTFILADYNPSVLQLVTLPNFILTWALCHRQTTPELQDAFLPDEELELTPPVLEAFERYLSDSSLQLSFLSGGWSSEFIELLYSLPSLGASSTSDTPPTTLLLGAETIYSPFALQAFTEMVLSLLERDAGLFGAETTAWVAAKRLYFGVGGSLDDFVDSIQARGAAVTRVREEAEGVRRGVVRCVLARPV